MQDAGAIDHARGSATFSVDRGPDAGYYTVVDGDTAIGIDARFRMCRDDFGELNGGVDAYNLHAGQSIVLGRTTDQPYSDDCA